jgi:cobalamin biosynthesis Mg chelatase CobN
MNRPLATLLATVLAAGALSVAAAPAQAAADCTGASDVVVVVDYKELGAKTQVLCAEDADGTTVLETLRAAGLETAGTTQEGDAALCRVDNLPSPQDERCQTYSDKAYWAISLAGADADGWAYAQKGVTEQTVQGGGFVGLSYEPITADASAAAEPGLAPDDATRDRVEAASASDASEQDDSGTSTSTVVGFVVGALLVLVLVAAIVVTSRRRRA